MTDLSTPRPCAATGQPLLYLRTEGSVVLAGCVVAYGQLDYSWLLFFVLFLLPDLSMLGYLRDPRTGAALYNIGHTYLVTLGVVALGIGLGWPLITAIGLIWTAHVGFDRALGYGLKYPQAFKSTHLM
ncbi:MAG: DUF4260 family protein [Limimaricola sp.]|uniref:DUF4260 domain-containing protein n=1 Tax=Limimaricola sp. TaxID=2211665 RepID=UPI001DBA8B8F|nr:DUF4260 domain-containing protein [Limimaricola sp.]MBI1418988.1 DUF4260 family protein [Limimaricola sp.]